MPSVLIALPVMRGQIEPEILLSLMASRRTLYRENIPHWIVTNESSLISSSRNTLFNRLEQDYIMWVDSDMNFPPYGISRLISRGKDIIGGAYVQKKDEAKPLIFKMDGNGFFRHIYDFPRDEPFLVDGIGTGFLLVSKRVHEAFAPDITKDGGLPFDLGRGPSGNEEGEDLSFCRRAKEMGFEIWCDPTIPLGHVGKKVFTLDDFDHSYAYRDWREKYESYDNDIDGWATKTELNWLHKKAKDMNTIVEVGSWKGRSTHALLSGTKGTVFAIDHFKGSKFERDGPHAEAKEGNIEQQFLANVGHFPNLEVLRMDSLEAAKQFDHKSVDMTFIDGGHSYEEVIKDIHAWLPKTKRLICGHDYSIHAVQEAVTEVFGFVDRADGIWIKKL